MQFVEGRYVVVCYLASKTERYSKTDYHRFGWKKHQQASLSVLELLHGDAKCSGDVIWILKRLRERIRCCWLTFSGFVIPDAEISFTQDAFV